MSDVSAIATAAWSGLGFGEQAVRVATPGLTASVAIREDAELKEAGLRRPMCARAFPREPADPNRWDDFATELLHATVEPVLARLAEVRPGWQDERIGVAIGTSSGGILSGEQVFALRAKEPPEPIPAALATRANYFAPFLDALRAAGIDPDGLARRSQVLTACSASTIAIGLGMRWLSLGVCDVCIAGGFDAVSVFVAAGFEALRATTASHPRPFRVGRDGMSLGEGSGVVALVRGDDERGAPVVFRLAGFGASTDAVHITAPDRTGGGLARAARAALADAGWAADRCPLVSAHGTATPFNDAMEARAIASVYGHPLERAVEMGPVVHPFKAQIGHTLGAAGVLETLATVDALRHGVAPATAGDGEPDSDAPARILERAEPKTLPAALKLSAAFGGANAALVLSTDDRGEPSPPRRGVGVSAWAHVDTYDLVQLSEQTGVARDRLARLDELGRLALSAVATLAGEVGKDVLAGAGIVVGHGFATVDTNERFNRRRLERGAAYVEPRVFPATSPNVVAGECAIVFQLTGPGCAVSSGLDGGTEALCVARDLLAAGDADHIVVVAVDDGGDLGRALLAQGDYGDRQLAAGAVAVLLRADPLATDRPVSPGLTADHGRKEVGHLAVLRWLGPS